jgi:hypothetical protein
MENTPLTNEDSVLLQYPFAELMPACGCELRAAGWFWRPGPLVTSWAFETPADTDRRPGSQMGLPMSRKL